MVRTLMPVLGMALLSAAQAEITFAENGEVTIPAADCEVGKGVVTARFKFRRWGMYTFTVKGGGSPLEGLINGKKAKRPDAGGLGDFYISKEEEGPIVIEVRGVTKGVQELVLTPACEGTPVVQKGAEPIELDARDSTIHGVRLVYEPQPKKLCVGYWINPKDYPEWEFTVSTPGTYEVLFTQGCGKGAGGTVAVLETEGPEARVRDGTRTPGAGRTGRSASLGKVTFKEAGVQSLTVKVVKKARGVMDIRRIILKPIKPWLD